MTVKISVLLVKRGLANKVHKCPHMDRSVCPFLEVLSALRSDIDDFLAPKMSALGSNLWQHKVVSSHDALVT